MEQFALKRYAPHDSSHDISHAQAVASMTLRYCSEPEMDLSAEDIRVAEAAAWLHDLLDQKYVTNCQQVEDKLLNDLVSEEILTEQDARRAISIARTISFSARVRRGGAPPEALSEVDTLLYKYVSDADMLEALGAIGVIRTCVYQSHKEHGGSIHGALVYARDTLCQCVNYMTHPAAKLEAESRRDTMLGIIHAVGSERS